MVKTVLKYSLVFFVLFGFVTAYGAMYSWTDENGVLHFSNRGVPPEYSQKATRSEEIRYSDKYYKQMEVFNNLFKETNTLEKTGDTHLGGSPIYTQSVEEEERTVEAERKAECEERRAQEAEDEAEAAAMAAKAEEREAEERSPTIISGEWDNRGNHYRTSGNNNLWRDDGTLMIKAGGGYIDNKTKKFIPAK